MWERLGGRRLMLNLRKTREGKIKDLEGGAWEVGFSFLSCFFSIGWNMREEGRW